MLARQTEQEAYLEKIEIKSKINLNMKNLKVQDSKKRRRPGQNYQDFGQQERQIIQSLRMQQQTRFSDFGLEGDFEQNGFNSNTVGGPASQQQLMNL